MRNIRNGLQSFRTGKTGVRILPEDLRTFRENVVLQTPDHRFTVYPS